MDVFFESPIPVLLVGLVVGSALGVGFLNTGRRGPLIGMGAVLFAVIAGIALERSVKTDREQIAETLDQLATALEADGLEENTANEVIDAVMLVITKAESESADQVRQDVRKNLQLAKITRARYSNLRVEVNKLSLPPSAKVQFDAMVSGEGRPPLTDIVAHWSYPLGFDIKMVYETDDRFDGPRWLIGDRNFWWVKTLGENVDPRRLGFKTGEVERH